MYKKTSFYILSNSGSASKQITFPHFALYLLCIFLAGLIGFGGYFVYDYVNLRKASFENETLQKMILSKSDKIAFQNKQIQEFANKINVLKLKLVGLNNFAKKIRIIADHKENKPEDEKADNIFGVGGFIPDDIDTQIPADKNHNSLIREMHGQLQELNGAVENQENQFKSLLKYLDYQINLLGATPSIRPTNGWITCAFGYRDSPFTGNKEFHRGLDIANRKGTPIYATANGIVGFSGMLGLMGNMVLIDHGHGMVTRYGHADKLLVKQGDKVKRGDVIALIGSTGRTTGPHVHYEVFLNGVPVDPENYILN